MVHLKTHMRYQYLGFLCTSPLLQMLAKYLLQQARNSMQDLVQFGAEIITLRCLTHLHNILVLIRSRFIQGCFCPMIIRGIRYSGVINLALRKLDDNQLGFQIRSESDVLLRRTMTENREPRLVMKSTGHHWLMFRKGQYTKSMTACLQYNISMPKPQADESELVTSAQSSMDPLNINFNRPIQRFIKLIPAHYLHPRPRFVAIPNLLTATRPRPRQSTR